MIQKIIAISGILMLLTSCGTVQPQESKENPTVAVKENEKEEWDVIVMDADYNTFMTSYAKPRDFYSEEYYRSKNTFLVSEWNARHYAGKPLYEVAIEYNPNEKYGIDFEYKLYNFFRFVEWKYNVRLGY